MIEVDFDIDGLDGLEDALVALGTQLGAKVVRSALVKASTPLLDEIKRLVPVGDRIYPYKSKKIFYRHRLSESLGKRSKILRSGIINVQVGAVKRSSWRAHLVEFGTIHAKAQPFIKPAQNKYPEALAIFKKDIAKKIERARKVNNR